MHSNQIPSPHSTYIPPPKVYTIFYLRNIFSFFSSTDFQHHIFQASHSIVPHTPVHTPFPTTRHQPTFLNSNPLFLSSLPIQVPPLLHQPHNHFFFFFSLPPIKCNVTALSSAFSPTKLLHPFFSHTSTAHIFFFFNFPTPPTSTTTIQALPRSYRLPVTPTWPSHPRNFYTHFFPHVTSPPFT